MTTADDNPYGLLAEDHDEGHRRAFGTGFNDPLAGIDSSVPPDVDAAALARYCLALGDDALICSRLRQTEALADILAEPGPAARAHPDATW